MHSLYMGLRCVCFCVWKARLRFKVVAIIGFITKPNVIYCCFSEYWNIYLWSCGWVCTFCTWIVEMARLLGVRFMVDKNASRPRGFLWGGGIMMAFGYSLLGLAALYYLPGHFLLLASFNLIVGMGAALAYHSALATNVRNWPVSYRGVAVGVPVAAFGLSAFLYTQLARWKILRFPDTNDLIVPSFLFLMSGASVLLNGLAGIILRDIREAIVVEEEDDDLEIERLGEEGSLPIGIPLSQASSRSSSVFRPSQRSSSSIHSSPSSESTLKRLLTDPDAILLAISMFCVIGVGLMYINNVGAIVMALIPPTDLPMKMQSLQVGLISIGSFLGRILSGIASDLCWRVFKLNRLIWPLFAAGLVLSGCLLSMSMESIDKLTIVTALMGLGYGVMWTSLPVLVGEFFGTTKFASHWYIL